MSNVDETLELRRRSLLVAGELGCDVRSVLKVLRGGSVRGILDARIRQAIGAARAPMPATAREHIDSITGLVVGGARIGGPQ